MGICVSAFCRSSPDEVIVVRGFMRSGRLADLTFMNEDDLKLAEGKIARLQECCRVLQNDIAKVLIGQDEVLKLLLTGLLSGGHMLVIGDLSKHFSRMSYTGNC